MAAQTYRLFKIASEINIGKEAIVSFLQSKGYEIENKPTAVLTEEMVETIHEKFRKEIKAAEKQREKVEKHKQVKKPSDRSAAEGMQPDMPEIPGLAEIPLPEAPTPEFKMPEVSEIPSVNTVIELPVPAMPERKVHAPSHTPEKQPAGKPDYRERARIPADRPPRREGTETAPHSEDRPRGERPPRRPDDQRFRDQGRRDFPERKPVREEETAAVIPSPDQDADHRAKKKKKQKKLAEVQLEPGQTPKLKGLTIVGKIDLQAERELPKRVKGDIKKLTPAEEEEENKARAGKGKKKGKIKDKGKGGTPAPKLLPDKKKKRKKSIREMISEEDIDRAIKETLSDMDDSTNVNMRSKIRQKKRIEREEKEQLRTEQEELDLKTVRLTEFVTTSDLAKLMKVNPSEIIIKCMQLGLMVSINQRLDKDTITLIADDYGMTVEFFDEKAIQTLELDEDEDTYVEPRSPIVTIMGHVDHGKTSLLDRIRLTNVVAGEAGGITQHIGAYRVDLPNNKHITFLDTPGHEAFTAMRARGAQVTDIVVLVVSADDSVMPQTIEAISHAQAANVPIIVAINKIDKPDAKPDRIRQQLADRGILVEDWGGKYQCVEISAKAGLNIEQLLDKILLEAEMLELKANPHRKARCIVIESNMDKGFGPVSTVIVQKGTMRIGDPFVAGMHAGRVRAMFDERGKRVEEAYPSVPVRVIGFEGMAESGDTLAIVNNDSEARQIASQRHKLRREQEFRQQSHVTLDDISKQIQLGGVKDLYLIIKGDVGGSVEALSDSLLKLSRDEVRVSILYKGVGSISESDVMLAVASKAIIIGFQVNPTAKARKIADAESVEIRLYNIIYDCINEVKLALEGLLAPEIHEEIICTIEVRKVFRVSRSGNIAGCYIQNGKITRNDKVRVLRDGLPVFTGGISSLKRGKDDVREVDTNYECGISLDGFNAIEEGDIIEGFKTVEVRRSLS